MADHFQAGLEHFNASNYFEAHETWEEIWLEESGARRAFLQGLIQVAVALHHATTGNWRGAHKVSASALSYLEKGRSEAGKVDAESLREKLLEFDIMVQKRLAGEAAEIPYFQMPMKS